MTNDNDEDEVGYRRPPKHTRFTKGQSGNPKGRPKREERGITRRQIRKDLLEQMEMPTTVTMEGVPKKVPFIVVIVRQLLTKAAKGDFRAIQLFLRLREQLVAEHAQANSNIITVVEALEKHHLDTDREMTLEEQDRLNEWRRKTRSV